MSDVEQQVRELLAEVYLPEGVDIWIAAHNHNLDGHSARELLDTGDGERVLTEAKRLVGGAW